jgi:hypothetical protein
LALRLKRGDFEVPMHRRTFLAALAAAPLLSVARAVRAQGLPEQPFVYPGVDGDAPPPAPPGVPSAAARPHPRGPSTSRLKSIVRDALGTTLWLSLDHAPFAGGGYRDDTVIVFVPSHYRFEDDEGVATLTHLHGHSTTAERAMVAHQLREQVADSKQNAILVVPQLAVMAADSSCGKLESAGGLQRLLEEVIPTTAHEARSTLGDTAFPRDAPVGTVCVSAHSGGYHAAACVLRAGGVDVRETYLFDALYAEADAFRDWVVARQGEPLHRRHKLVSYFTEGGATEANDRALRAQLERAGVLCQEELEEGMLSRHDLSHAEAVFVRSGLWHSQVTWETNALRDCLFASALPRHVASTWFARKNGARPIERRR